MVFFFFQAEDGIRDSPQSRGLGDVYKRQDLIDNKNIVEEAIEVIEPIVEDAIEVIEPLKENSNTDSENLNSEIGDS